MKYFRLGLKPFLHRLLQTGVMSRMLFFRSLGYIDNNAVLAPIYITVYGRPECASPTILHTYLNLSTNRKLPSSSYIYRDTGMPSGCKRHHLPPFPVCQHHLWEKLVFSFFRSFFFFSFQSLISAITTRVFLHVNVRSLHLPVNKQLVIDNALTSSFI